MEIVIKGLPKEIAALVLAVQERRSADQYTLLLDGKNLFSHQTENPARRDQAAGLKGEKQHVQY